MRELDLGQLVLHHGAHADHKDMCVMEAVAYIAGEPWSDRPKCACPVISAFLRRWNDDLNDTDRQLLKPLIPKLVNSKVSKEAETKRRELISDWFFREQVPTWLDLAGLKEHADGGRLHGADYKWDAAGDAAWDAAMAAAMAAAWAAAGDAAGDAAWGAAWDAAWAAARAAAWAAAGGALRPTVEALQKSAIQLIEKCLEIK
jgi:hypothetical protein